MTKAGARIALQNDIVVTADTPLQWGQYMFVANGREVTIDLNGHDIIFDETGSTKVLYLFTTANKGVLNIVGEGNIIVKNGFTNASNGGRYRDGSKFITVIECFLCNGGNGVSYVVIDERFSNIHRYDVASL